MDPVETLEEPGSLGRVRDRLRVYLDRFAHRLTTSDGRLDDLYVSLEEARATLAQADGAGSGSADEAALPPAIDALGDVFGLDPLERELLLLAAAPGLDRGLARLYTFAWADFTLKQPTAGFIAELAGRAHGRAIAALRPDGRLVGHRLLRLHATEHWRAAPPLLHMGVAVPEGVLARLRGEAPLLDGYGAGRLLPARAPGHPLVVDPVVAGQIEDAWARASRIGQPVVLVCGQPGSGRRTALAEAARADGRGLMVVETGRIPAPALAETLCDLAREARASGVGMLVRTDDLGDEAHGALAEALRQAIAPGPLALGLTARRSAAPALRALGEVRAFELPTLSIPTQIALWTRALGDDDPARARRLTDRFSMPAGAIIQTAEAVRRGGGPVTDEACAALLRSRIDHALDTVADPVHTTLDWGDVVLPPEVRETLEEIRAQARHRTQVFDDWGFRRKMAYGRGLGCLFSGPPGTGKTMMAGIIANDLGRAIYRVDLSRTVSKWVGETEKNLARVFDEAEQAQVILFFDEADSLFSTRTEVKGANDRFANMEVNYLLQRMEQYDGMSILTTNFERSIDEAFKRRLKFRVHFPLPEAEQRAELWQRMVPEQMRVADDIRWDALGKAFKFSGGAIKNAVLRAAFYAAEAEGVLTHALLARAADAERREMGRL